MKFPKIDASIVCFAMVVLAAIPVATLRTKTYAIGYELGKLKETERTLRQKNIELQSDLASVQRSIRDRHLSRSTKAEPGKLQLPGADSVIHAPKR